MKNYIVFAGVNGAGKSTAYRSMPDLQDIGRINSDEILREFGGDWKNETDQYTAGKIAIKRIDEYFEKGISFSQETTLSTKLVIRYAIRARELGYFTEMNYVSIDSPETAIQRICHRVKFGGHGIDADIVRRRYKKSITNLRDAINTFNVVFVYDNTIELRNIAMYYNGSLVECVDDIPEWFDQFVNGELVD